MSALPAMACAKVRLMQLWAALPVLPSRFFKLQPAPGCVLFVHSDTLAIDVTTMDYVFRRELFSADLHGRVAIDIGAHKGYFGSLALIDGARAVYSFEPESRNYAAMQSARVAGRDMTAWSRRKVAVGAVAGETELHVSSESWSHSVYAPASGTWLYSERVPMVAFADVLADVARRHPDAPVVLKLNVEGAAGDCVLSVAAHCLRVAHEILIDLEKNTPQRLDVITDHIASAGFDFIGEREGVYRFTRSKSVG
jgi:FkbM family methyltransferase